MHNTNLMAFQTDLRNVNWNSINDSPDSPVFLSLCSPSKIHKEYLLQILSSHKRVMHNTNVMAFQTDLRNVTRNKFKIQNIFQNIL